MQQGIIEGRDLMACSRAAGGMDQSAGSLDIAARDGRRTRRHYGNSGLQHASGNLAPCGIEQDRKRCI